MKIKHVEYVKEILTEQMNHWTLFPLVMTIMGISRDLTGIRNPDLLLWEVCSLIPFLLFLLRWRIKRFYVFALSHIGILGVVLGINSINPSFVGGICICAALAYAVLSLMMQMKDKLYTAPIQLPVGVAISAVAIWLQHYQGTKDWDSYYIFCLVGTISLFFVIFYLQHYLEFLAVNQSSAGYLPASEMFRSGLGLTLAYTFLGAVVLIVSTHFEWLSQIVSYLKEFMIWILRLLFSNLPQGSPEEEQQIMEQFSDTPVDAFLPREEPFWLWGVLWHIVVFVFLAVVFLGVAKLLIRLLSWLRVFLVSHGSREDLHEESIFDVRERCEIEQKHGKKKQPFFGSLSSRERIRKLYKRKLLSSSVQMPEKERNLLEYRTAREWESTLETEGMAEIYERARYSDREVTTMDVKQMKAACK